MDPQNLPNEYPALTRLVRLVIGQERPDKGIEQIVRGSPPALMLLALKRLQEATENALSELAQTQLVTDDIIVPQFMENELFGFILLSGDSYSEYLALRGMPDE